MIKSISAGLAGMSLWATLRLYVLSIVLVGLASLVVYIRHGSEFAFAATPVFVCIVVVFQFLTSVPRSSSASTSKADAQVHRLSAVGRIMVAFGSILFVASACLFFMDLLLGASNVRVAYSVRDILNLTPDMLDFILILAALILINMAIGLQEKRSEKEHLGDQERTHRDESS